MARRNPYRSFPFYIEMDGIIQARFSECSLLDTKTDPVEYRKEEETPVSRKLSGLTKYGNITLKRGINDSTDLYQWRKQVIDNGAGGARKNISIILINKAGENIARWDIVQAWPTKCDPPDFNAKGNEVVIETLKFVHEGLRRVSW